MRVIRRLPSVQPSTGCTEPAAVALAAGLASSAAATRRVRAITVVCDRGTFRNGLRSGVPGAGGRAGLELAAALGALAGDPERRLDVLAGVKPADVERALALVATGRVTVTQRPGRDEGLWIEVLVHTRTSTARARLAGGHTRVVHLRRDDAPLPLPAWSAPADGDGDEPDPGDGDGALGSLSQALALADALDDEDEAALLAGLDTNLAAALVGGRGPGAATSSPEEDVEAMASAASRARMCGEAVTVVTSGWSGNQGLVATLPIAAVASRTGASRREVARALATSHLVARLLRERSPSPLCHALLAASAGAAAACARLLGGDPGQVERAAQLVVASVGAATCDGAKPACSLRVGLGAAQAIRCARRALEPPPADLSGGLVGATLEETARELARAAERLVEHDDVAVAPGAPPPCGA